jgi:hypothetical protein
LARLHALRSRKEAEPELRWIDGSALQNALYPSFYRLLYDHINSVAYNGWIFQAFLAVVINSFAEQRKLMLHFGCRPKKNGLMKAKGLAGSAKRILEGGRRRIQSYEGRMRVFELGIMVVALIALTILIVCLFSAWMAFEESLGPAL